MRYAHIIADGTLSREYLPFPYVTPTKGLEMSIFWNIDMFQKMVHFTPFSGVRFIFWNITCSKIEPYVWA